MGHWNMEEGAATHAPIEAHHRAAPQPAAMMGGWVQEQEETALRRAVAYMKRHDLSMAMKCDFKTVKD